MAVFLPMLPSSEHILRYCIPNAVRKCCKRTLCCIGDVLFFRMCMRSTSRSHVNIVDIPLVAKRCCSCICGCIQGRSPLSKSALELSKLEDLPLHQCMIQRSQGLQFTKDIKQYRSKHHSIILNALQVLSQDSHEPPYTDSSITCNTVQCGNDIKIPSCLCIVVFCLFLGTQCTTG